MWWSTKPWANCLARRQRLTEQDALPGAWLLGRPGGEGGELGGVAPGRWSAPCLVPLLGASETPLGAGSSEHCISELCAWSAARHRMIGQLHDSLSL